MDLKLNKVGNLKFIWGLFLLLFQRRGVRLLALLRISWILLQTPDFLSRFAPKIFKAGGSTMNLKTVKRDPSLNAF